ncbi:MAG: amidohydrolase family protein [Polyangiaceae bacterium]
MRRHPCGTLFLCLGALLVGCSASPEPARSPAATPAAPPTAAAPAIGPVDLEVRDVRLFDGVKVVEHATVDVRGGAIVAVREAAAAGAGASPSTVVDGAGKTLLPGLIDAHAHVWEREHLAQSLAFGVTTVLDQFSSPGFDAAMRDEQKRGAANDRADLRSAGILVTAPKGHGTEYGFEIPTLAPGDDAQAFVDARLAEGSDWIKIVYDDGRSIHFHLPTLTREQMGRVVAAAHARSKMAVVHVSSMAEAKDVVDAGADGLAHLFFDAPATPELVAEMAQKDEFVIATLSVIASAEGKPVGKALLDDPLVSPYITAAGARTLVRSFRVAVAEVPGAIATSVGRLKGARVPLLVGTDAPNEGTTYGATVHEELALLVEAGLTPTDALVGATSAAAARFHLDDRGRIAPGMRADMVLVTGDPTSDVRATRAIDAVWKGGVRFDRDAWRASCTKERAAAPPPNAVAAVGGIVSDFDDGTLATKFGAGWDPSTDKIAGGASTVELSPAKGGAKGTKGALRIAGEIAPGLPYAWAGAMFWPGAHPMEAVDASKGKELVFWAKGDPGKYRVMLFARSHGRMPMTQSFEVGTAWKEYRLALGGFNGTDAKDITGVLLSGGPKAGKFAIEVDQVELR